MEVHVFIAESGTVALSISGLITARTVRAMMLATVLTPRLESQAENCYQPKKAPVALVQSPCTLRNVGQLVSSSLFA
jgi:hypothetical protein